MGLDDFTTAKSKIDNFKAGLKKKRPGSLPAILILVLTVATLIIFDITDRMTIPKPAQNNEDALTANMVNRDSSNSLNDNLARIIKAAKKTPFKAKITTENGFKGYWTQSGDNYRFEDPSKQNVVIFNASRRTLWVIDITGKVAVETLVNTSTAGSYVELSPAFFVAGYSDTATAGTKTLEDMLPANKHSKLTFTKQGLPETWEGRKRDGSEVFIRWEYIQADIISPSEFVLPEGLSVTKTP